jgi:hypothetical protein
MIDPTRPQLPGTLHGLLDAGTRLYRELQTSDDLLRETLAALGAVERAIERGEDVTFLRFEIGETVRLCAMGQGRVAATLRHFARDA